MEDKKDKQFHNRSLERALHILCAFSPQRRSYTLKQLAEAVDLPKTTVSRLCTTLSDFGFLQYDRLGNQYTLGLKLFELGSVVLSDFSLRTVASPYLDELQLKIGKTIFLGIFHEDEALYIDKKEDPRNPVRFASSIGTRRPPYFGLFGQLFMAFLPESEVDRIFLKTPLQAPTRNSITDVAAFKERLRDIRKNDYLIEEGEAIDGVTGISAPIRDHRGKVVAGVGASFITSSEDEEGKLAILKEVIDTARTVSRKLGYAESADA